MSLLAPLKTLKIRLFSTFRIFKNCCQSATNRLLIRKKTLTVWKLQTIKVILYSNLFFMFSQDDTFALKLDKSLYPVIMATIQTPRRETYYPCESLISRTFNGDYYTFYHNYFIFSKI